LAFSVAPHRAAQAGSVARRGNVDSLRHVETVQVSVYDAIAAPWFMHHGPKAAAMAPPAFSED